MEKSGILVVESTNTNLIFLFGLKKLHNDERLKLIQAKTLEIGEKEFDNDKTIKLVVLFGCSPDEMSGLISFIEKIRNSKPGIPIIVLCLQYYQLEKLSKKPGTVCVLQTEDIVPEVIKQLHL